MFNEDYIYKEPEERIERRNNIRKNQIPIEKLEELIEKGANEQEIQRLIKKDMSFLSDWLQSPMDEYICLSELPIGNSKVDFAVLTSRSRMLVYLIEIKGANFNILNKNHYKDMNMNIHNAVKQISNHIEYIEENYEVFRKYIHNIRHEVIDGNYNSNSLLGPKGYLQIDPNKNIKIETVVIGGKTVNDYFESSERTKFEKGYNSYHLKICSWNSFLTRIDENHGNYF